MLASVIPGKVLKYEEIDADRRKAEGLGVGGVSLYCSLTEKPGLVVQLKRDDGRGG